MLLETDWDDPDVKIRGQCWFNNSSVEQTRPCVSPIQFPLTHLVQRQRLLSAKPTTIRKLPGFNPLTHLCCKIPQNVTGGWSGGASALTLLSRTGILLIYCFEITPSPQKKKKKKEQTNKQTKNKNSLALPSVVMRVSSSGSAPVCSTAEVRENAALLISSTTTPTESHRGGKTKSAIPA